ncbi:hypothetical protein ACUNI2_26850 [Serratia sp. IR-2025]
MTEVLTYEALKAERDALAVENASLKSSVDLIASAYTEGEPAGFEIDRARHIETPATDAALAEIKAQGLDELANACDGYAENHVYTFTKRHAEEFAANLREAK